MIVVGKNPLIKELSGSRIEFFAPPPSDPTPGTVAAKEMILVGGKTSRIVIPFSVRVIAGGKLDLDFSVSEKLAAAGVNLIGAYWDGSKVTVYLMPLEGIDVHVPFSVALIVGTLVQVATYKQVQEGVVGAMVSGFSEEGVMILDKKSEKRVAKTRKARK